MTNSAIAIVCGASLMFAVAACSSDDDDGDKMIDLIDDVDSGIADSGITVLDAPPAGACGYSYNGMPSDGCLDIADAIATAAARCGGDYQANYDAFISQVAGGSCNNIVQITNPTSFYDECLPWFCSASCADLQDANAFPSACQMQLGRPQ